MNDANHTDIDNQTPKGVAPKAITSQKSSIDKLVISNQTKKLLKLKYPTKSSKVINDRKIKKWRDKNNLSSNSLKAVRVKSIDSINSINNIVPNKREITGLQKAQILNQLQSLSAEKRLMLLRDLKKSTINIMTINEKRSWFHTLGVVAGIDFDKERLLRGESTANVDIRSSVLSIQREIESIKRGENIDISSTCEGRADDTQSMAQSINESDGGGGEEENPCV